MRCFSICCYSEVQEVSEGCLASREGRHCDCQKTIRSSGNRGREKTEEGEGENVKLEESLSSQLQIQQTLWLSSMHINSHTLALVPSFCIPSYRQYSFSDLRVRKRQCRCCVCACVSSRGWHILYIHSSEQMRRNMFYSVTDKQSSDTKWSTCVYSPLPKVCQKECFSCQQMMETMFGDIWGCAVRDCNSAFPIPTRYFFLFFLYDKKSTYRM